MQDTELTSVVHDVYTFGKKAFEDALMQRSVYTRKVLIEKHLPKYMEPPEHVVDEDFITSMGALLFIGEAIRKITTTSATVKKAVVVNKQKKHARNSMREIAKFTIKTWFSGIKKKWKAKGKSKKLRDNNALV